MEVAGLAIGALALISMFKDCVDLFGMIAAGKSLGKDAEILNTKLDIEKMLFLQWADRMGLVEPSRYDQRLKDQDTHKLIARVLNGFQALLGEGRILKDRYGLAPSEEVPGEVQSDVLETEASTSRMRRFVAAFEDLSIKHAALTKSSNNRSHTTAQRVRWVIRDKEKFQGLIKELSYFNSRLDVLVPRTGQTMMQMSIEDLGKVRSIGKLKTIIKATVSHQPDVVMAAQSAIRTLNEDRILRRLEYRWRNERRANIKENHFQTLDWVLNDSNGLHRWDNLSHWLSSGSNTYWLAGKAGSGKSTVMKYLINHPYTGKLLNKWAGGLPYRHAHFFFYALGRSEQKSQQGLLRALLYQILDAERSLIEEVLPETWQEAIATEDQEDEALSMPTIIEMAYALERIVNDSSGKKLWLVVDGLDEFEGKHTEVAALFQRLGRSSNTKFLLSSRPLAPFVAAFNGCPKMYLQDLNYGDIYAYIDDKITKHPYMSQLSRLDAKGPGRLAADLLGKSSGVFLWVVLACQSVLEGFAAFDSLPELRARVEELPNELEDLFKQMLQSIEKRWHDEAIKLLRIVFDNQVRSDLDMIPTLGLALIDQQGLCTEFRGPSIWKLTEDEKLLRCQIMEGRLRSRCQGLLETQSGVSNDLVCSQVVFMHRSLYEFLCTPGLWQWNTMRISDCTFNSHVVLASLWTQLAGLQPWGKVDEKNNCARNALIHGFCADASGCPVSYTIATLSRLQGVLRAGVGIYGGFWEMARRCLAHGAHCQEICNDPSLVVALAAEFGMLNIVRLEHEHPGELRAALIPVPLDGPIPLLPCQHSQVMRRDPANNPVAGCGWVRQWNMDHPGRISLQSSVFPLLYHATSRPLAHLLRVIGLDMDTVESEDKIIEMVRYLLAHGHDPNERFYRLENHVDTTPWLMWLRRPDKARDPKEIEIRSLLFDAGVASKEHQKNDERSFSAISYNLTPSSGCQ